MFRHQDVIRKYLIYTILFKLFSAELIYSNVDVLIKSRLVKAGGVRHVSLRDYYLAVILTQLKAWFPPYSQTLWAELESSQIPGNGLYLLLLTS